MFWGICGTAYSRDVLVLFDLSDEGESKSISTWGFDVTWPSRDNTTRTLAYMGADEVDFVRVGFLADTPLVGGALSAATKAGLDEMAAVALLAGAEKPWTLMPSTEEGVDSWYKSGSEIVPSRWVQGLEAAKNYYNHEFVTLEPFNEPDYGWGQGTSANLVDICTLLGNSEVFSGVELAGGSTLNSDASFTWYRPIKNLVAQGTTHNLAGTFASYAAFVEEVIGYGDRASNPEAHNVVEVIVGAEYGIESAAWWAAAERARARFVEACQGMRLGYAEDRVKWTAAAIYRGQGGAVEGFVGASERVARTTSYRFVSEDRDVFYDGYGPMREYLITIPGGNGYQVNQPNAEKVVSITWGEDIQPVIDGEYVLVNKASGKVLELAGAGTEDGVNVQQGTYVDGDHQRWEVRPLDSRSGGDYSYFSILSKHSQKALDVYDWSLASGGDVRQWTSYENENQEWYLEYSGNGYFFVRSRWSTHCLSVAGGSENARQETFAAEDSQLWRLVPVGAAIEFEAPSPPVGLRAAGNAASVALSWQANAESDLAGYNVYRSLGASAPFDLIARGVNGTSFVDNGANGEEEYRYRIKAVDESLNLSAYSQEVAASPYGGRALLASYGFEGDLADGSANGNLAIAEGGVAFGEGKRGASALSLNGTDAFLRLPATVANSAALSFSTWLYWDGGDAEQRVFDFGKGSASCLFLTPKAANGGMRFVVRNGGVEEFVEAPALAAGRWSHLAVVLGEGRVDLYLDGALVGTGLVTIGAEDIRPVLNYIGASQDELDPLFAGKVDAFELYNFALSETEVRALAGVGSPAAPAGLRGEHSGDSVALSWEATPGALAYSVKRSAESGGPFMEVAGGLAGPHFVDTELFGGKAFYYTVSASNEMGEGGESEVLYVSAYSAGEEWRLGHFGAIENAGDAADEADPDGDGISNLLERAFGGDPWELEAGLNPTVDTSAAWLSLVYRKAVAATDLEFAVEERVESLAAWAEASGEEFLLGEEAGVARIRFTRQMGGDSEVLLRVRVGAAQ